MMELNGDHILGLVRFARNCLEIEDSALSGAFYAIITEHQMDAALISDYEGPADAIRTLLEEWFEIEE